MESPARQTVQTNSLILALPIERMVVNPLTGDPQISLPVNLLICHRNFKSILIPNLGDTAMRFFPRI